MRGRLPVTGSYTGSGSAQGLINLGFRPKYVIVQNITDGTVQYEGIDGQADGGGLKSKSGSSQPATATNAITFSPEGFSLGSDADLCTNAKVFLYVAF